MNHYELLGVDKKASLAEIKAAFRKKVKRVHPDLNPGKDKQEFIRLNEAYEILSDATSRNLYDLYLDGVPLKTEIEIVTPEYRHRENYRWQRVQEERQRMQDQIVYKQKFYRHLRFINMACFVIAILLSFDYYQKPEEFIFFPEKVEYDQYSTIVYLADGAELAVSEDFFSAYKLSQNKEIVLLFSPNLLIPKRIKMKEQEESYLIKGSIYVFGNGIGTLLFIFSIIIVANKQYSDARLTFGIFSVVILIWTLAMVLVYS